MVSSHELQGREGWHGNESHDKKFISKYSQEGYEQEYIVCLSISTLIQISELEKPQFLDALLLLDKTVSPLPPGGRNTSVTCPEFTCLDGTCVPFTMVNQ